MADVAGLYQQLEDALKTFKKFLDDNTATVKTAVGALKPMVPQIVDLLNKLIDLMNQLSAAIQKIDVGSIPGLSQLTQFTTSVTTLLTTAESLLPDEKPAIDDVLSVANVVTQLPSLDTVKKDILDLLTAITTDLKTINS